MKKPLGREKQPETMAVTQQARGGAGSRAGTVAWQGSRQKQGSRRTDLPVADKMKVRG